MHGEIQMEVEEKLFQRALVVWKRALLPEGGANQRLPASPHLTIAAGGRLELFFRAQVTRKSTWLKIRSFNAAEAWLRLDSHGSSSALQGEALASDSCDYPVHTFIYPPTFHSSMGVGRIFSRWGATVDFFRGSQKDFYRGGQTWLNFIYPSRNYENNPFFLKLQ